AQHFHFHCSISGSLYSIVGLYLYNGSVHSIHIHPTNQGIDMNPLYKNTRVGHYTLRNRFVMAPMTRSRADDASGVPSTLATQYYAQRANAGLIITEGTFPSPMGKGYVRTPGIHSTAQVTAWKHITEAVH